MKWTFEKWEPKIVSFFLPLPEVYRILFNLNKEIQLRPVKVKVKRASPFFAGKNYVDV